MRSQAVRNHNWRHAAVVLTSQRSDCNRCGTPPPPGSSGRRPGVAVSSPSAGISSGQSRAKLAWAELRGWRSGIPCGPSVSAPAGVPIEVPCAGRELLSELGFGLRDGHPSYRVRPFVAFDQHIQLTAVGEVIFRASRHQTQRPDRQEASGLQFTTDFGLRACTPCRLPSHQPRKGASRMLRSLMAKRCRYQARPRGTCLASARRSPANSRLKPNRGYS
jgi:hypothetical protein